MNVTQWKKVRVGVQSALAAAIVLTAVTAANPAVASSVAHGLLADDIVLCKIAGIAELDYRVVKVSGVTADAFALTGIDGTNFDPFTVGTVQKITFGTFASTLQDVNTQGGEAAAETVATIHSDQDFELPGNRSPLNFSFGSLWDISDPALIALNAFDESGTAAAISFTFLNGAKVYFAAIPSAPLAPAGSAGQAVTTPVKLSLRGKLTAYAGA